MKTMCKRFIAILGVLALLLSFAACTEKHSHNYSEWGSNKTHHWKYCPDDQERDESTLATHVDENTDGKCDVCGYDVGLPHEHDYSAWGSDAEKHWKYCPDDNEKDPSTEASHADADSDGKCDACGRALDLPDVEEVTVESAEMKVIDGKPYLIVKGIMPTSIPCIKLHADATVKEVKYHYYGDNVSTEVGKFELRFDLSQVIAEETPWMWFHIYTYNVAEPADPGEGFTSINTAVDGLLELKSFIDCDGARYTVTENDYGLIVVQRTDVPQMAVNEVAFEQDADGKPVLVVKGVMPTDIACIKLHADAEGENYYGDNVSTEAGKFELRFDLTQIRKDGKWAWFHIYTYNEENPTDNANPNRKTDLNRNDFLPGEHSADYNGIRYEIANDSEDNKTWNMICFYANEIKQNVPPAEEVTEVTVKEVTLETIDGKAMLVVKGVMPTDIACIKLHADGNDGDQFFGDNVSTETGKFELHFDLTQTPLEGTPWLWFHIYTYEDADPADKGTPKEKIDLQRNDLLKTWQYIDCGEVRYKVQDQGQLVIQPNAKPIAVADSMNVELIDGKLMLVIKGTMPEEVPCIKIHAWANADYYGDNVSTEAGKFELHFDLTQVSTEGTPWMWFHIYIYRDAEPTDLGAKAMEINLDRGTFFAVGEHVEFNGVRYEVQNNGQLAIQPTSAN